MVNELSELKSEKEEANKGVVNFIKSNKTVVMSG